MSEVSTCATYQDCLDAGNRALAAADWEASLAHFECAVQLSDEPEALEGLGMAAWWLDSVTLLFESRERAYIRYRQRGDLSGAARVATWLALDNYIFRHAPAIANGWLRRADRILAGVDKPAFEHCFYSFCRGHIALEEQDNQAVRHHAAQAHAIARELGNVDFEMLALALQGLALVSDGRVEEGMSQLDEAVTAVLAGELTDPDAIVTSCCYLFYACERVRDYERAAQWCDNIGSLCRRLSYRSMVSVCRVHYASVLIWRGEWSEAEKELSRSIQELLAGRAGWATEGFLRLAELRRRQGRLSEAAELFERGLHHPLSLLGKGELALTEGDATRANDFVERYFRRVPKHELTQHFNGLDIAVRVSLAVGDLQRATELVVEIEEIAATVGTEPLRAGAFFARGIVAVAQDNVTEGQRCLEDAVDLYLHSRAPYETARARVELARALAARERTALAVAECRAALDTFNRLGALVDARQVVELVYQLEGALHGRGRDAARFPGLTRRESEVLALLAAGHSNPQIADDLYLSVRTVERHVSSIYQKIGAEGPASRAIAAAYALEYGTDHSTGV